MNSMNRSKWMCHSSFLPFFLGFLERNLVEPWQLLRDPGQGKETSWLRAPCLCNSAWPEMTMLLSGSCWDSAHQISSFRFFKEALVIIVPVCYDCFFLFCCCFLNLPLLPDPFLHGIFSPPTELVLIKDDNSWVLSTCSLMNVI